MAAALPACESVIGADFDRTPRALDAGSFEASAPSPFEVVRIVPDGEKLTAIWGASPRAIFAVGTNGIHLDFYGGSWHRRGTVKGRDYYAVWGTSATDVYTVGLQRNDGSGVIAHFDGEGWSDEYVTDAALYGVWGSGGAVLAVGARGMLYGKQGGGAWAPRLSKGLPANPKVPSSRESPILWSISGNGPNDFAIAADVDRVFHYAGNGAFVSLDPSVDRSVVFRTAFAAPSAVTSVFFGSNYFGLSWLASPEIAVSEPPDVTTPQGKLHRLYEDRSLPGSKDLFIRGVWADTANVLAVGDAGRIMAHSIARKDTVTVPAPSDDTLNGVWGSSADDVWIVGDRELILHGHLPQ